MSTKGNIENNGVCVQFSQHVWKKDVCKNCSRPQSAHKVVASNNIPKVNAGKTTKINETKIGEKPEKPVKKPILSKSLLSKQSKNEIPKETKVSVDPIYDIYDVAAKGQSGKPVSLDEAVNSSSVLMATPYTVVDVIASSLEKSRQTAQAIPVKTPVPPNHFFEHSNDKNKADKSKDCPPASLINSELKIKNQTNGTAVSIFKPYNDSLSKTGQVGDSKNSRNLSEEKFKARLYEEIDDVFLEKVESFKNESKQNNSRANVNEKSNKGSPSVLPQNILHQSDNSCNKTQHLKTEVEVNKKKTEKKSFLKRLLGKSNKSIEGSENKLHLIIKNNSLSDILDGQNHSEGEVKYKKKLSQGDLLSHGSVDVTSDDGDKTETSSRVSTTIGGSGTISSDIHNASFNGSAHDLKPAKFSLSSDDLDSVDDKKVHSSSLSPSHQSSRLSTEARKHPQFISATMRRPHHSNRKSMTSAETRITRRMLMAPPPPPTSISPTQLSSSSFSTATLNRPIGLGKKRPEPEDVACHPRVPKVEGEENKSSLLDGFMADLDAILKKGGVAVEEEDNQTKSLPRLHPLDQMSAPKEVDTLPLSFASTEMDTSKSVQQRALPDIPLSTPPPLASSPAISPDNDGLYEVLPNIQNKRPQVEPPALPSDKPRPAPRPAIRSVTMTTRQKRRGRNEDGSVDNRTRMSVKLNDSLDDQFKKINLLSSDSLHSFLEQFHQSFNNNLLLTDHNDAEDGTKDIDKALIDGWMERLKKSEGKVVYWRRCVFFEVELCADVSVILMVRQATAICVPLPTYHHRNLVHTLASFHRTCPIPRCTQFYQEPSDNHYKIDILPYSSMCSLVEFTQCFLRDSGLESPNVEKALSNKMILLLFLQVIDSLLHLQRLGVTLNRLQAHDVIIVTCRQTISKEGELRENNKDTFPILLPTELEENNGIKPLKHLLNDLSNILQLLISCNHTTQQVITHKQPQPTPKYRTTSLQHSASRESKFINCLSKLTSYMAEKASGQCGWKDVEVLKSVLESVLWEADSSEEEIRLAYLDPKRRDLFLWWLTCARQRVLNQLIVQVLPSKHPSRLKASDNTTTLLKSLHQTESSCEDYERFREACYLSKCTVDSLLEATKLLYF